MPEKKSTAKKRPAKRASRQVQLSKAELELLPHRILPCVQLLRGEKVLLDADLADLYGVSTGELNQATKRNASRFPRDFMFQLSRDEWHGLRCRFGKSSSETTDSEEPTNLKSQSVMSSYGGRRTPPYAFTEQGVAMLSSVLNSDRAIQVNIAIMRSFVQLRELMADNKLLAQKVERLEKKYDGQFREVFYVIGKILRKEVPNE